MSTTLLKLPADIQQRVATAAATLGITPHAFMVAAILDAVDVVELRTAGTQRARQDSLQSEAGYEAAQVRAYLRARLADPATPRPAHKR